MIKGQIISGKYNEILIREKNNANIELGELLIADKTLLQVYNLIYASQISQQNIELISGLALEESQDIALIDENLKNYKIAVAKPLYALENKKVLPKFLSFVRDVKEEDLKFLLKQRNAIFVGNLRSGSRTLNLPIYLPSEALNHHILVAATTGKGKSNLVKVMLYDLIDKDFAAALIADPHKEYYSNVKKSLKDHKARDKIVYYARHPPAGAYSLIINLKQLKPWHFQGVLALTDAQESALLAYFKDDPENWIKNIMLGKEINKGIQEITLNVLRRKLSNLLDIKEENGKLICKGAFDFNLGEATIAGIVKNLEKGKTVILDTSSFSGSQEVIILSVIAWEIFERYKEYAMNGLISEKPAIAIVLEEAPRVLSEEALKSGTNIFSTIAREGRKFKIGLIAITQMPSLIPRQVLANMNTKIILGLEMKSERNAIIESAPQDLSKDDFTIASLNKGEAIITSTFVNFPLPIKIPLFEDFIK